jgi:hypothetical protein
MGDCRNCARPLPVRRGPGRPRRYCSANCRDEAWQKRLKRERARAARTEAQREHLAARAAPFRRPHGSRPQSGWPYFPGGQCGLLFPVAPRH